MLPKVYSHSRSGFITVGGSKTKTWAKWGKKCDSMGWERAPWRWWTEKCIDVYWELIYRVCLTLFQISFPKRGGGKQGKQSPHLVGRSDRDETVELCGKMRSMLLMLGYLLHMSAMLGSERRHSISQLLVISWKVLDKEWEKFWWVYLCFEEGKDGCYRWGVEETRKCELQTNQICWKSSLGELIRSFD